MQEPLDSLRLGALLVAEGAINEKQLQQALDALQNSPHLTLGRMVSMLHRVPKITIDELVFHKALLPMAVPCLLERLDKLAAADRFSRGLVPSQFIARATPEVHSYKTEIVESSSYVCKDGVCREAPRQRFVVTTAQLSVAIITTSLDDTSGDISIRHSSLDRNMHILQDDDALNSTLYYDLKAAWLRSF